MSDPASTIDIPLMLNGRKVGFRMAGDLLLSFGKHPLVTIARDNILACVHTAGRMGVCLRDAQVVVPGTKKPVQSCVITWAKTTLAPHWDALVGLCQALGSFYEYRHVECTHSICGRKEVQMGRPVVVWAGRACTLVPDIDMVILQRTKGGMSTYDVSLVPPAGKGDVVQIDMLPHSTMDEWADLYPDSVIDAGPDPLPAATVLHAQQYGKCALMEAIDSAAQSSDESDVGSAWMAGSDQSEDTDSSDEESSMSD